MHLTPTASRWPVLVVLAIAVASACGGDDERAATAPTAAPSVSPAVTPAESVALKLGGSATAPYRMGIPEGWDGPRVEGGEDVYDVREGGALLAQLTVACSPVPAGADGTPLDVAAIAERERASIEGGGGEASDPVLLTVAGEPAAMIASQVTSVGAAVRVQSVFVADGCLWALRLRMFEQADAAATVRLFARMVASFEALPAGTGGRGSGIPADRPLVSSAMRHDAA